MYGAKVIGREDKLGIYRLQFADAAATDAALDQLKTTPTCRTWTTIIILIRRRRRRRSRPRPCHR